MPTYTIFNPTTADRIIRNGIVNDSILIKSGQTLSGVELSDKAAAHLSIDKNSLVVTPENAVAGNVKVNDSGVSVIKAERPTLSVKKDA